ncbi:tetratricopeptide repeat protein, partial [Actinosynnema sp. NPDC023658]|uniref:tetratricopeptide repeat protein n=1 Tax=Actinosynnema sp. NPDC023658 TaxID=3155465 RepID=UPI0033C153F4
TLVKANKVVTAAHCVSGRSASSTSRAAAGLLGLPESRTRRLLDALEEASLLDHDGRGRWRMHDLVRACATTTDILTHQAREAALRRVLDFYVHTAYCADQLLEPQHHPLRHDPPAPDVHPLALADIPAALAWFDAEHLCLLAAQRTAITHQWHSVVWHLAWSTDTFRYRRGHHGNRLTAWQAALDAATHLSDPATRIVGHQQLAHAQAQRGRYQDALEHLRTALALAVRDNALPHQAGIHRVLAQTWQQQGDDRQSLEHARCALEIYRDLDLPVREADMLAAVGWFTARLGDYDTARGHLRAALALNRRHHHPTTEANTLDSLGWIAHRSGHHTEAIRHYREALALFRVLGDTAHTADTLDNLGHPHLALGRHARARAVWCQAFELYRQQGRDTDAKRVRAQLDGLGDPSTEQTGQLV